MGIKDEEMSEFQQGYACAVATMIAMNMGVETDVRELFHAGLGNYDLKKFRKWKIAEDDIEVFKKYRKEIK